MFPIKNVQELRMLAIERIQYIQSRVASDSTVKVDELAQKLRVSAITIRRDLKFLEKQGKITRIYGGAIRPEVRALNYEERYSEKIHHEHTAKIAMAHRCLALIPNGSTVILDAGTSVFELAILLRPEHNLTVATYDIRIASMLCQRGVHTFVAGGEVQNSTGALFGACTEDFIEQVNADIGILGVAGIGPRGILHSPTMSKARIKQQVIHSSRTHILLADSVKFNVSSLWKICSLDTFDHIITNAELTDQEWEELGVGSDKLCRVTAKLENNEKNQGVFPEKNEGGQK